MGVTGDLFAGVVPFVHVARTRSFRQAGEELGVSAAAISKAVQRLEEDLGARLFERSSRRVSLTPEGEQFLVRCQDAVSALQAGREVVSQAQSVPRGELVLSLPPILGRRIVAALGRLLSRHPQLALRLVLTDRRSDLVAERIDVALRMGELEHASLIAKRLAPLRWMTVASPGYLARHGAPRSPEDLARHDCLRFVFRGSARAWVFREGPRAVEGRVQVDQGEMLVEGALAGLGVAQVLSFMAAEHVREGRLVEVLSDHAAAGPALHAVCLAGKHRTPKVRACLEWLGEVLG